MKDANELIDDFNKAKTALFAYISTEEATYTPLNILDCREESWTGGLTNEGLKWSWDEVAGVWDNADVNIHTIIKKDGLAFIWYFDGDRFYWVVLDDSKIQGNGDVSGNRNS